MIIAQPTVGVDTFSVYRKEEGLIFLFFTNRDLPGALVKSPISVAQPRVAYCEHQRRMLIVKLKRLSLTSTGERSADQKTDQSSDSPNSEACRVKNLRHQTKDSRRLVACQMLCKEVWHRRTLKRSVDDAQFKVKISYCRITMAKSEQPECIWHVFTVAHFCQKRLI